MARVLTALLVVASAVAAADLKVLMVGGSTPASPTLLRSTKREVANNVMVRPILLQDSPGVSPPAKPADILIAPGNLIDDPGKQGKVAASTRTLVAKVGIGVAVRAGAAAPDVATVEALKQTLLNAGPVVYNQGSSGLYMEKLFEQMGIADQLRTKTVRFANAGQVVQHVMEAQGNEIAFAPLPEILSSDPKRFSPRGRCPLPFRTTQAIQRS